MSETINKGWLKDTDNVKFAPKSLIEQIQDNDGKLLSTYIDEITSSYLPLSGGTLSGDITSPTFISTNGSKFGTGFINLIGLTPFIDFHYGDSETRTSRIIEESSGTLTAQCNLKVDGELYENGKQLKLQYAYTGDGVNGNNSFSSLQDFVAATATDLNPRLFRVKDVSTDGFMPAAGSWYRVITMYQNGYNNGNYSLDGSVLAFDSHSKLYLGSVEGKGTDDITIAWDEVVLASQLSSLVGSTHTHAYLSGWSDTRNVATTPDDYNGKFMVAGLKTDTAIGTTDGSTYNSVIGFRAWNDSTGGQAHELAFTRNGSIYHRYGATDTWNSWTQILNSGNWSSYCAAKSHSHNYAGSSSAGGAANSALVLGNDTRMNYGWNGVNYFNISGTAGNAAKVNDTPTTAWWHIMRFNHSNSSGYYTDLAIPFNDTSLYYKRITGGSVQNGGWVKVLDALNWSSYAAAASHNHSAANITSGTLGVARGGTGATTFTSGAALIGAGTGAVTTRAITNMTSKNYITYNTNLMTTNTLAYWNGAYSSAGGSNLTYCNKGAFGTIVTKGTGDYVPYSGGVGTVTAGLSVGSGGGYIYTSSGNPGDLYFRYTASSGAGYSYTSLASIMSSLAGKAAASHGHTFQVVEISHSTPAIDFHFNNSTADYTSRIIEASSGELSVIGALAVGGRLTVANTVVITGVLNPQGGCEMGGNLSVSGHIYANGANADPLGSSYAINARIGDDGRIRKVNSSSIRYKNHISDLTYEDIEPLYTIPTHWFKYKPEYIEQEDIRFDTPIPGYYVEDWMDVMPIAIDLNKDGLPEMWNQNIVIPLTFEMVKGNHNRINDHAKEIDTLKAENANLRATNEKYEERLAKLEEIIKGLCA